jgi:[protein-PII] uridylyltransferase
MESEPDEPDAVRLPRELLDADDFDARLAQSSRPVGAFREALSRGNAEFKRRWHSGIPAAELAPQRAAFMDALIGRAWQRYGACRAEAALIAVGGYGRSELHPGSDIDLMLLLAAPPDQACQARLGDFITFLWDIGLEVGSSVRTLEECSDEAKDLTVITNIMEARRIAGSRDLFRGIRDRCGPDRIWPSEQFFLAKRAEQEERHRRFDDTAYRLEPNLKEGPGGLRDIQTIGWVAKRHFGTDSLHGLVDVGFLTEDEYHHLIQGQGLLWDLRWGLHLLTGRREDRLLFDYQTRLAEQRGLRDRDGHLAVEQLMKSYYRTVMELGRLNEMLLQLFAETLLPRPDSDVVEPIDDSFRARNDYLEALHHRVFDYDRGALLRGFLILARHPELQGMRADTIRLIRAKRGLIDEDFRADPRHRALFMELLRQPRGITGELRRMNRYGILAAYLPEFARIVGQTQYDLFHAYTVDQHTLFTIRNLRRFFVPEHASEFPACTRIAATLPKPELLYLAGLFHDIAKGRGGDHSKLGAADALCFCRAHGLSRFDAQLVSWLVENHLKMSATAQRQDISDPEVIGRFARRVGDMLHLDYLYLLTVADMRATNPELWNSWKNALLLDLYNATRHALRQGLAQPIDKAERIRASQQQTEVLLATFGVPLEAAEQLWSHLPEDYFLRFDADEIAWHTRSILAASDRDLPLIPVRQRTRRGGTEVFLYGREQPHLFALVASALDRMDLDIQDARIITGADGLVLDSFTVLEADGEPISNPQRLTEIPLRLQARLKSADPQAPISVAKHVPRRLKQFKVKTEVLFHYDSSSRYNLMEVIAADRPGLLARVGQALQECGISLQSAKIATFGAQVDDFFVLARDDGGFLEHSDCDRLRKAITDKLEEP